MARISGNALVEADATGLPPTRCRGPEFPANPSHARLRIRGGLGPEFPKPEYRPGKAHRLVGRAWRHRRPLTQPATDLGLLPAASGHLFAPGNWTPTGTAEVQLQRPEARAYVALVRGAAATWTAAAWRIGPGEPHLAGALGVGEGERVG